MPKAVNNSPLSQINKNIPLHSPTLSHTGPGHVFNECASLSSYLRVIWARAFSPTPYPWPNKHMMLSVSYFSRNIVNIREIYYYSFCGLFTGVLKLEVSWVISIIATCIGCVG